MPALDSLDSVSTERAHILVGVGAAILAVYVLPIFFGPLAMYLGLRLSRRGSPTTGWILIVLGGLGLVLGLLYAAIAGTPGIDVGGRLWR